MNRQVIIRGAAIAFAGVAASVFAAQQFLDLGGTPPTMAQGPNAVPQAMGASLMGSTANVPQAPQAEPTPLKLAQATEPSEQPKTAALEETQVASLNAALAPEQSTPPNADFQPPLTLAQASSSEHDGSCAATLNAIPAIDALVDLRLRAPCAPNTRIVISHDDLAFSAFTDDAGELAIYVPALTAAATFEAFMPDQSVLSAQALITDIEQHVRVIVQWTGSDSIELHAYHRAAGYGDSGHINATRPFDPDADAAFVLMLGEARGPEPMLAQIYSVPVDMVDQARAEIEVNVTPQTCGNDFTAFVSQKWAGAAGTLEELSVAMPDCSEIGSIALVPLKLEKPGGAQVNAALKAPLPLE